ncbi:hypothetical protein, conserved [Angomonas deanei]|uniref:Galactosyltransferase n=1 Tax=Angomonas deanei TaxID=59799 RepID=A0A7G2CIS3_9TRYP|nr:hypothetical protein, conserved [Angomonas deanei]
MKSKQSLRSSLFSLPRRLRQSDSCGRRSHRLLLIIALCCLFLLGCIFFVPFSKETTTTTTTTSTEEIRRKLKNFTNIYQNLTNEDAIREGITPLHVVLACSTFKAENHNNNNNATSLYGALQAAKTQYGTVGCATSQDNTLLYPWWALPSSPARKENPYLLVQAIATVDSDRRTLRYAHRDTFTRYRGAATRRNGFRDKLLFLYVLAAHYSTTESLPVTAYKDATVMSGGEAPAAPPTALFITPHAVEESLQHFDVLWLTHAKDAKPSTNKKLGEEVFWGPETEVGMTRKLCLFLLYGAYQFPHVPFLGRGDDDAFYKVPQIILELEKMQDEMTWFNQQSKRYHVRHGYWGGYTIQLLPGSVYPAAWFLVVSTSLLQECTTTVAVVAAKEGKGKEELLRSHILAEGATAIQVGLVASLSPYEPRYTPLYRQYGILNDDVFSGVLVSAVRQHLRSTNDGELVYYRVEPGCRAHNLFRDKPNILDRRKSFAIHRAITPQLQYQLFLYFSDPTHLFQEMDDTKAQFVQALRWGEDNAFDAIDFDALQKTTSWEMLFPSNLTERAAALDCGPRWWDHTLLMTDASFEVGVSRYPFTVYNATKQKGSLFPPTTDVGADAVVSGVLPRDDLVCLWFVPG